MIRDVFYTYFGYSFPKDKLCSCIFKGRSAVVEEILLTLQHSSLVVTIGSVSGIECMFFH